MDRHSPLMMVETIYMKDNPERVDDDLFRAQAGVGHARRADRERRENFGSR